MDVHGNSKSNDNIPDTQVAIIAIKQPAIKGKIFAISVRIGTTMRAMGFPNRKESGIASWPPGLLDLGHTCL